MTRPPTTVLLMLSCVVSMSPWPRFSTVRASWTGRTGSSFSDRMALFKHVMQNDDRWGPVLEQRVKLSELTLPQYRRTDFNGEALDRVQLVAENYEQDPTISELLSTMMNKSSWSGTNVNYVAYALSTAFTCFTYKNVSVVLTMFVNRISVLVQKMRRTVDSSDDEEDENNPKNKDGDDMYKKPGDAVDGALDDVRMMLIVLAGKVAAVDGELGFIATGLYDYDSAENTNNDLIMFKVLEMIKKEVDQKIKKYCHITLHKNNSYCFKLNELLNPSSHDVLETETTLQKELVVFEDVIESIVEFYDRLDIEIMSMDTWLQVLDYKLPISMNIKFFIESDLKVPINPKPEDQWSDRLKSAAKAVKKDKKKGAKKKSRSRRSKKR